MKRSRLKTDAEILRAIYERYQTDFVNYERDPKTRGTKVYVPIDIPAMSEALKMEPELVFGRLHYHMARKYARQDAPFFEVAFPPPNGPDRHVINFPLLESTLAELEYDHSKFWVPTVISIAALLAATVSATLGKCS